MIWTIFACETSGASLSISTFGCLDPDRLTVLYRHGLSRCRYSSVSKLKMFDDVLWTIALSAAVRIWARFHAVVAMTNPPPLLNLAACRPPFHGQATREPEKTLQGHRQSTMGHQDPPAPSRAHTASSTSHAPRNVNVPSNWAKGGPTAIGPLGRTNGSLFSKGGGTNASTTTVSTRQNGACRNIAGSDGSGRKGLKGPSECPFCKHSFAITLGQWEVQTHIQQCLESLEGVFDAEE